MTRGVSRYYISMLLVCVCMVPSWRQLNIVASNRGSYLVWPFSHLGCGTLFLMCAAHFTSLHLCCFDEFHSLKIQFNEKCGTLFTLCLIIDSYYLTTVTHFEPFHVSEGTNSAGGPKSSAL